MPNHVSFENDLMLLTSRVLTLKRQNRVAELSKNQTKLIYALMNKVNDKSLLIGYIWPAQDIKRKQSSFSQLVFQTRLLLKENNFPPDFIITLPGYGLCLNTAFLVRAKTAMTSGMYIPPELIA